MSRTYCAAVVLLAGLLTLAPALAEPVPFPATIGQPYTGRMTIDAFLVNGGRRLHRDRGDTLLRFSGSGEDQILFGIEASLDQGGSLDLEVTLVPDASGVWRGLSDAGPTEITQAGRVLSVTELEGFHMVLTGRIGPEDAALTLRRIPTENAGTAPDADMMTVFTFDVSLTEPAPSAVTSVEDQSFADAGVDGGCARTEWRLVNRWTWGNGLSLSREPHCVP